MGKVFNRYFYAISSAKVIDEVTNSCNMCLALKKAPKELFDQSTTQPPIHPGRSLAADVICRSGQKILVVRDTLTSYTTAMFIQNEASSDYKEAIMICTLPMKSENSIVRVDCAPGLVSLKHDIGLHSAGIYLDFGRIKNKNKNPVAEKANQELELEILKIEPSGGPISALTLTKAVCTLNTRIRHNGLSSREMYFRRDQISGEQLDFSDSLLRDSQLTTREKNHLPSARCKACGASKATTPAISVGSVVFVKQEGTKFKSRESYIVISLSGSGMAVIQKLDTCRGYFGSVKYEVPLENLYLSSIDAPGTSHIDAPHSDNFVDIDCSDIDDSDYSDKYVSSDSDSSVEEVVIPRGIDDSNSNDANDIVAITENAAQRQSSRSRRQPQRFGGPVSYDCDSPFDNENDTVENWWPNYPRGSWSPNRGSLINR